MNALTRSKWLRPAVLAVVAAALAAVQAPAQKLGEMKGFTFAEYYPPQETQMKSKLEGDRALRRDDGTVLVTGARLHTFRTNGEPELSVTVPQCVHDPRGRSISSPGPLQVRTADGLFSIEGQGFWWGQTNSALVISNAVHTVVQPSLLARSPTASPAERAGETGQYDIVSDRFEYAAETGLAVYSGHVRVSGTNLVMQGGRLTLELPFEERQLRRVTAEESVALDYAGTHATGEKAVYDLDTGLVHVSGQPTWEADVRQGRADEFLIDRTNHLVRATGNAWLKMPAQAMGGSALLPSAQPGNPVPAPSANQFVEIRSANYELRTNSAVFGDNVQLTETTDGQERGRLTSRTLTAFFSGTNQLSRMVAEDNVVISQEDNQFHAAKAVYTAADKLLELTGAPWWRAGARSGKGDVILVRSDRQEMTVRGNASMQVPAAELGMQLPGASKVTTETGGGAVAEVLSREYTVRAESASFEGGVSISHPQMAWSCDSLTLAFPRAPGAVQQIVAENKVVFDLVDEKGQKVRGTGQKAVYRYGVSATGTNDLVELSGDPVLTTTNGVFRNRIILWDRARNKFYAPGRYLITGTGPAMDTNRFQLPTKRRAK